MGNSNLLRCPDSQLSDCPHDKGESIIIEVIGVRILLAIDPSAHSWKAVEAVAARPWPPGSIVLVLSAVEYLLPAGAECWVDAGAILARTRQEMVRRAEQITHRAVNLLGSHGLRARAVVRDGNPRAAIIREATEHGTDLIVVGSRASSGLKRWLTGSVSQYVVAHAPCSVEVVQQRQVEAEISAAA